RLGPRNGPGGAVELPGDEGDHVEDRIAAVHSKLSWPANADPQMKPAFHLQDGRGQLGSPHGVYTPARFARPGWWAMTTELRDEIAIQREHRPADFPVRQLGEVRRARP